MKTNGILFGALGLAVALFLGCSSSDDGGGGEACSAQEGQCPNICTAGTAVQDEICESSKDCSCGLSCLKDGDAFTCQPYTGDNAGCSCSDVTGGETTEGATTEGATTEGGTSASGTTGGSTGDINDCKKAAPDGATCNPYCQLGCNAGQQCTHVGGGAFGCLGAGDKGMGEVCNGSADCQAGMACFRLNGETEDTCRKFCVDDSECGQDRKCDQNVNFPSGASASFCGEIAIGCNAFDQAPCGEGEACYYNNNATKCMAAGTLEKGAPCASAGANACLPGLQCVVVCAEVCSFVDVSDDQPKCTEACGGPFNVLSEENGIGFCVGDEPPKECDVFEQTGCAAGQACYATSTGWRCLNAGTTAIGETCQFTNDCVGGGSCINQQCQQICSLKADASADIACSEVCKSSNSLNPEEWKVGFCTDAEPAEPCDFWAQDCTEAGKSCYWVSNGSTCMEDGGAEANASCQYTNDCKGGLMCVGGTCTEVCNLNDLGAENCYTKCDVENGGNYEQVNIDNQVGKCK